MTRRPPRPAPTARPTRPEDRPPRPRAWEDEDAAGRWGEVPDVLMDPVEDGGEDEEE